MGRYLLTKSAQMLGAFIKTFNGIIKASQNKNVGFFLHSTDVKMQYRLKLKDVIMKYTGAEIGLKQGNCVAGIFVLSNYSLKPAAWSLTFNEQQLHSHYCQNNA